MELRVRNVNQAFHDGIRLFHASEHTDFVRKVSPRGMLTMEWHEPVATVYEKPRERVLFNATRDANPFLHFFEALWMLAGRNDLKFMLHLSKRFADFSDNGRTLSGAYGARWRSTWYDQFNQIIELFRRDPDSRRAVLQMWGPMEMISGANSKDQPCNTNIYFKMREGRLDMTVCCRSNDMLWGAYGANAVHFSMLQEYMAGRLSAKVGRMTQFSDSLHVYLPPHPSGELWQRMSAEAADAWTPYDVTKHDRYEDPARLKAKLPVVNPYNMMNDSGVGCARWDVDLLKFFKFFDDESMVNFEFETPFFSNVVTPLWLAYNLRKDDPEQALQFARLCAAKDWSFVAVQWLERRNK